MAKKMRILSLGPIFIIIIVSTLFAQLGMLEEDISSKTYAQQITQNSSRYEECVSVMMNLQLPNWKGILGEPKSNITKTTDGLGSYQNFTDGAIYAKGELGAFVVTGQWYDKWEDLGLENGALGYPLSNLRLTLNRDGHFNEFENGAIFGATQTGIHEIHGPMYQEWNEMGRENSILGYPISDVQSIPGGAISYFEGGSIA